ncbi:hypothetical protein pb186bvf_011695 [Paramecium bursaria]
MDLIFTIKNSVIIIYFQVIYAKVAYFLGNYGKVLEIWQQTDESKITDKDYYYFLISRALIASRELKTKTGQVTKEPSKRLLEITELTNKWIGPILQKQKPNTTIDDDRRLMEIVLQKAKESNENKKIMQLICAYLSVNSCEALYTLNIEQTKDYFGQEITFLQLLLQLRGRRFDLAEQSIMDLKKYDDEDILTYLGQIYSNFYGGQPDQALKSIQETKERFGESAKLMNLRVSCLIGQFYLNLQKQRQNKFEEAFEFANKLQSALIEKEQFSDRSEIEVCLSNLIVLSEINNKPAIRDECFKALQTINPASQFLKRKQLQHKTWQSNVQNIKIPLENLTQKPLKCQILQFETNQACIICLQDMNQKWIGQLQCKHSYHWNCINQWYQQSDNCPLCKTKI